MIFSYIIKDQKNKEESEDTAVNETADAD